MLTGVAIMVHGPGHDFPGAGIFVIVVLVAIVLIFVRVYGGKDGSGRPTGRRFGRRTGHDASHRPGQERPEKHEHPPVSRRRPKRQ
jgi:hypothetical protein